MTSIRQLEPDFYSKTHAFVDVNLPRAQQYKDTFIFESFKKATILLKFFQLLKNPETVASNSPTLEAASKRVSHFKADSVTEVDHQRIRMAFSRLDEVEEQTIKEFRKYLASVMDSLAKNPSNLVFKSLVKTDLLLTFYERTENIDSLPSPPNTSDEDGKLAADFPTILNALAIEYEVLSEFEKVIDDYWVELSIILTMKNY